MLKVFTFRSINPFLLYLEIHEIEFKFPIIFIFIHRKHKKKRQKTTQNHELKSPHFDTSDKDSTGSVGRRRRSGADSETSGILVGKEETDEDAGRETTGSLQACVSNDYVNFPGK